jgi:hypothetical protein
MALPPPPTNVDDGDDYDDDANTDSVTDAKSNPRDTGATGRWTPEEDTELTGAVANTCKQKWGKQYRTWPNAALAPGRTKIQCCNRWHHALNPSIALTARRMGRWTEDEDIKLKGAVQMQADKDWAAIAALVPGRTRIQCSG